MSRFSTKKVAFGQKKYLINGNLLFLNAQSVKKKQRLKEFLPLSGAVRLIHVLLDSIALKQTEKANLNSLIALHSLIL